MLAVSLGLKLADSIRRVCMYTKDSDLDKEFYALFRGFFPIQELCGTVTAIRLARRDLLGQDMPMWKLLLPSAVIHGMANFRGMKVRTVAVAVRMCVREFWHSLTLSCCCWYDSPFSNGIRQPHGQKCNYLPILSQRIQQRLNWPSRGFPEYCG